MIIKNDLLTQQTQQTHDCLKHWGFYSVSLRMRGGVSYYSPLHMFANTILVFVLRASVGYATSSL